MLSTSSVKELTYQEILRRTDEYSIFKCYIPNLRISEAILSPLRTEENPSFVVYNARYGSNRLRWMDYSTSEGGSCFDFVMRLYRCDFITALIAIDRDLNLGIEDCRVQTPNVIAPVSSLQPIRDTLRSKIEVGIRSWDGGQDKLYWGSYGIDCRTLIKYRVYPLSHFRINDHHYDCKSITYGYYFGEDKWKIYSPYGHIKWLSNTSIEDVQGFKQLRESGDGLVITKSLKDVMLLSRYNIPAIAPQSESSMVKDQTLKELETRFGRIIVNHDFDYVGVKIGNRYRRKYKYRALYLTNGRFGTEDFKAKDLSDYYKLRGAKGFESLLTNIKL